MRRRITAFENKMTGFKSIVAGRRLVYLSASRLISDSANSVHVMKMAEAFAATGLHTTLIATRGSGTDTDVASYYGTSSDLFRVIRIGGMSGFWGRFLTFIQKRFPALRLQTMIMLFHGIGAVRRLMHSLQPDVAHVRNLLWAIAALPRSVSFAIEIHQMPTSIIQEMPHRILLRRANLIGVVFISEQLRTLYRARFPRVARFRTLVRHDGANPSTSIVRQESGSGRIKLGYVGHLYPGRGVDVLLALARAFPELELHIVGGAADEVEYWRKSATPNVTLHGHVPHALVANWLASFDILLAPYQRKVAVDGGGDTAGYMSPLKLFEYMASGRAIICSDLPVLREILRPGQSAFMVEPDDIAAWAEAVAQLIASPEKRHRLGQNARADLIKEFSWSARAKAIEEFIFSEL